MKPFILICMMILTSSFNVLAKGVYQTTEQFISDVYQGELPKPEVIWLSAEDKEDIAEILNHKFNRMRIRYWPRDNETIWVLEEIGKEKPITIGVHIQNEQIIQLKVLAFRESRGDEIRHEFFTDQFNLAKLTNKNMLDNHIDGITGATLSVRATTKVARLALWLNNKVKSS